MREGKLINPYHSAIYNVEIRDDNGLDLDRMWEHPHSNSIKFRIKNRSEFDPTDWRQPLDSNRRRSESVGVNRKPGDWSTAESD